MGSEEKIIKADGSYEVKYSEELIELRRQFLEYAKINLPLEQMKAVTLALNKIVAQAIEDGASQGFNRGYQEALDDTWTLGQVDNLIRTDNQTFESPTEKITLTTM